MKQEYEELLKKNKFHPDEHDLYCALKEQYRKGFKEGQGYRKTFDNLNKDVFCSICKKDLKDKERHLSRRNSNFWNEKIGDWDYYLTEIFKNVVCQECYEKEFDMAHKEATLKYRQVEEEAKTNNKELRKELSRFHKLFSKIFIKI